MVATELAEDDSQLEVRIIRTKGGIRNVAYIAENDNSLIVQQKTTSTEGPDSDPNHEKNNQTLEENINPHKIVKTGFNKQNMLKPFISQRAESQHLNFFNNKVSPLKNSSLEVEVEVPKVIRYLLNNLPIMVPLNHISFECFIFVI